MEEAGGGRQEEGALLPSPAVPHKPTVMSLCAPPRHVPPHSIPLHPTPHHTTPLHPTPHHSTPLHPTPPHPTLVINYPPCRTHTRSPVLRAAQQRALQQCGGHGRGRQLQGRVPQEPHTGRARVRAWGEIGHGSESKSKNESKGESGSGGRRGAAGADAHTSTRPCVCMCV